MSKAIQKFNGLNGPIPVSTLTDIAQQALYEGQLHLFERCTNALKVAKNSKVNVVYSSGPALEQLPDHLLPGIDQAPPYLCDIDFVGLGKAVSQDEIYQYITDMMINTIEKVGHLPWQRSWDKTITQWDGYQAVNYDSKKPYRGANYWMTNFKPEFNKKEGKWYLVKRDLSNPYFLTANQIKKHKGKIKKGSSATRVIYFTRLYSYSETLTNGEKLSFGSYDKNKFIAWIKKNQSKLKILNRNGWSIERLANSYIPILKYYNVFHGADVTGIKWPMLPKNENHSKSEKERIKIAENIVSLMPKRPEIIFKGNQPAYYPGFDHIRMTPISAFKDSQSYYSTLFHELVHSSGHKSRLARPEITLGRLATKLDYAKEELTAEMGAVFLCAESGILFSTLQNSAKYLAGWSKRLIKNMKNDNRFFFRASSKAQAAADYILSKDKNGKPAYLKRKLDPTPKKVDTRAMAKTKTPIAVTEQERNNLTKKNIEKPKRSTTPKKKVTAENRTRSNTPKKRVAREDLNKQQKTKNTTQSINNDGQPKKSTTAKDKNQLALLGPKGLNRAVQEKSKPQQAAETFTGESSRPAASAKPLNSRIVSGQQIATMKFDILKMDQGWENLFQNAAKNMKIAIWGKPKNGKTAGSMSLANYLTKFGTVLYNVADQGINANTQDLWKLTGCQSKKNAFLTTSETPDELDQDIQQLKPDFVFIDMINDHIDKTGLKPHEFKDRFIKKYPNIGFSPVMEVTKTGNFKGDQKWAHLVDALVTVEDYIMESRGRYGSGNYIIWHEGAERENPKRYQQICQEQNGVEQPINQHQTHKKEYVFTL